MKITTQHIIRFLLVCLVVVGAPRWGSVAYAYGLSGGGTEDNPYLITCDNDWNIFRVDITNKWDYKGKYVKLTADIEIDNCNYESGYFRGTFDGNGHTIKLSSVEDNSPFNVVEDAIIKNLRVSGSLKYSNQNAGSLIAYCYGSTTVENCIAVVNLSINYRYSRAGGLVGRVQQGATLTINNCLFIGQMLDDYSGDVPSFCGGFVGTGDGTNFIRNSLFKPSSITVSDDNSKTFTRCANYNDDDTDDIDNTLTNCYYFTKLGDAQGLNATIYTKDEIVSGLGSSWTYQNDLIYLNTFCKNVQIKGWVVNHYNSTDNAPYYEDNYGTFDSDRSDNYYKGKDDGDSQYSTTVPSSVGGYTVKTKIYDGWESTKKFWIVNAPEAETGLTYDGTNKSLLNTTNNTTGAGTYYYRLGTDGDWSTTVPMAKDQGTYYVYFYVQSNNSSDHSDIGSESSPAGTIEVTIGSNTNDIDISVAECTYDGTAQTPAVTVKVKDSETVIDSSEYSVSYSDNTYAGTGKVTVTDVAGGNYTITTTTANFTINRKPLTSPAIMLNPTTMTYTGSGLEPEVTVYDGDTEISVKEYSVNYNNNTNVGSGEVEVSDKDGGNYSITTTTTTFTITKAALGCTAPKAVESLTYTGSAQELVKAGSISGAGDISGCTMMYSTDGSNYSSSLPTGTDAKTYTVYYKVTGDSNHKDISASSLSVTISPKTLNTSAISLSPTSYTYDGTAKEPTVTVKDGETTVSSSEYTVSYSNNTEVGTATATVTDNPGGNYEVNGSLQFTIVSADATYTPPSAKQGLTYNRKAQELISAGSTSSGTMQYSLDGKSYSTTIPKGTDAKEYTVYYKVVGDDNHGDSTPETITATISAKTVSSPVIMVSPSSYTYDGTVKKPSVTVKDVDTVIPSSEYTVSYSNNTNVGTATVTITDNDGGNYTVSGSANFVIVEADASYKAPTAKTGLTYNGRGQELITAGSATSGTMKYSLDDSSYSTDIPTGTDAKTYTVYYKVVGDDNHDDSNTGTLTVTISPRTVSNPKIELSPSSYTYDGTAKEPKVTVKDGETTISSSEYTVSYRNNKNVGTATVTVTDKSGGNYEVNGTAQFSIISADASLVPPTAKEDLVYNTYAQELINAGSSTGGTMEYSLDGQNYSPKVPKATNAGDYNVLYKVTGDPDHQGIEADTVFVTISAKTVTDPTTTVDPMLCYYDGTAQKPSVTVKDGLNLVPSSEYTLSYQNNIQPGTATIYITDKDGGNYVVNDTTTFTIVSADTGRTQPTAKKGLVYNGRAQELINAGVAVNGTMKYSLDDEDYSVVIPTGTDAGTYKVYYKTFAYNGFVGETASLNVTIDQKDVLLSVTIKGAPESVPEFTVTDEGGNLMSSDDYTYDIKDIDGMNVDYDDRHLDPGDYRLSVTPTGNYTGPTVTVSFHVRRALSFVFTLQYDLVAVCLPYDREVPKNYHVYCFDRAGSDGYPVFKQTDITKMSGGVPYLLRYVGSSSARSKTRGSKTVDLTPSNLGLVDLSIPIKRETNQNMIFTGTFDDMTNSTALAEGAYLLQKDRSWRPLDSSAKENGDEICLDAFQAYIGFKDFSTSEEVLGTTLMNLDGETEKLDPPSGINAVILEDEDGHQEWYDLQGRRIEAPQKGVNILRTEDGKTKKVVVR